MTVFFICPRPAAPSGGVQVIHRLANLLDLAGIKSRVIQTEPFELSWDANPIPAVIKSGRYEDVTERDTLVIPEVLWPNGIPALLVNLPCRKIVYVQNRVWIPQGAKFNDVQVMVCSRYLANHMKRMHDVRVEGIVRPYLDSGVWRVEPKQANRTLIMARRNVYHESMRNMLVAEGFPVEYVTEPLTQRELADRLADCEYYLHLTSPEGWPAAIAEAMRSGTIVVGTTGGGGNEFCFDRQTMMVVSDPEFSHDTPQSFTGGIMDAMRELRGDANLRNKLWRTAFEWSKQYTAEATTKELMDVFG